MNPSDPTFQQLRRQRNVAGVLAVGVLLIGFATTLPKCLAQYRALRAARNELTDLQSQIHSLQGRIVEAQRQLGEQQRRILALQKK